MDGIDVYIEKTPQSFLVTSIMWGQGITAPAMKQEEGSRQNVTTLEPLI